MTEPTSNGRGIGRFAHQLPPVGEFVTLGEGNTPCLPLPRLARQLGLARLSAKLEVANPTGSYKDRVAAMSISLARHHQHAGWIATSSGNAGMAMAAYGARAGLAGFVCLVATAPPEKRACLLPYGVQVVAVEGIGINATATDTATLFEQVRAAAQKYDLYLGVTAHTFNPDGMRGVDTIGYELHEQLPDATHIYIPTGGGGLLAAVARGLAHHHHSASIICCQPSGCAPVVRHLEGHTGWLQTCETSISGLQIPNPPDGILAAAAVTASRGWGTAVDDDAILHAQHLLASTEGLFVEPAAATALAALIQDLATCRLAPDTYPVLLLTGAGWKDLRRPHPAGPPVPLVKAADVAQHVADWMGLYPTKAPRRRKENA